MNEPMSSETEERSRDTSVQEEVLSRGDVFLDDTGLSWRQIVHGDRPGNQFIRLAPHPDFQRLGPGRIAPRPGAETSRTPMGHARRLLFGKPLPTEAEGPASASAWSAGPGDLRLRQHLLVGLRQRGDHAHPHPGQRFGALTHTVPITLAIVAVLAVVVVVSYRQVIAAYPGGGGSYVVAHENLGRLAGLTAGAALLTDYILTVAVSTGRRG